MLMATPKDILITGGLKKSNIRFAFCDVTSSVLALARSHLSGPAATQALAEGLLSVALLSSDLSEEKEVVSLHLKTSGPIESLFVEASIEGNLRGYTAKKLLDKFDGDENINMREVFGYDGALKIIRSIPGSIISESGLSAHMPRPLESVRAYYQFAQQRVCHTKDVIIPGVESPRVVRGLLIEALPDVDTDTYEKILKAFSEPFFASLLEKASGPKALFEELGITEITTDSPLPLKFGCHCSHEKALSTLKTFGKEELLQIVQEGRNIDIYCHMCGKCHTIKVDEIESLL